MTVKQGVPARGTIQAIVVESVITCPHCGTAKPEVMPTDACVFLYDCTGCGERLWAKTGDCCVFCSYGTAPCPPIQAARADGTAAPCCTGMAERGTRADAADSDNEASSTKRRHYNTFSLRTLHRRDAAEKGRLSRRARKRNFLRQLLHRA